MTYITKLLAEVTLKLILTFLLRIIILTVALIIIDQRDVAAALAEAILHSARK